MLPLGVLIRCLVGVCLTVVFGPLFSAYQLAEARPQYVNRVPTRYSCDTCHLSAVNRNLRTGFGIDFGLNRGVWANDDPGMGICRLDSDGDGLTNGEELADPDCVWRVGERTPDGPMTNPADARDPDRCGDGVVHEGETCDGDALGVNTCISEGFMDGEITCDDQCELDVSRCVPFPEPDQAVPLDMGVPDVGVVDALVPSPDSASDVALPALDTSVPSDDGGVDAEVDAERAPDSGYDSDSSDLEGAPDAMAQDQPETPAPTQGGGCVAVGDAVIELSVLCALLGLFRRRRGR